MNETNITEIITQSLNTIFSNFFASIDSNIYSFLDELVFVKEDILYDSYFEKLMGTNSSNGFLLVTNSLLIGFILYYAISLLLSHITFSPQEHPLRFIFKVILLGVFINSSYFICEKILFLNSTFSLAIREVGETVTGKQICFSALIENLNSSISLGTNQFNIFSFTGLLKSFMCFGLFNLIFSYSLRYVMLKVFVLLCPFAFLCIANEKTIWIFKSWCRSFVSLLLTQVLVSIILSITFSISFSSDLFSNVIYIGCIYALIKANQYMRDLMGGISTAVETGMSGIKSLMK